MAPEFIALLISGISLLISLLVTYLSYFRPANIEMYVGGRLLFYPAPYATVDGNVWGGFGFYLPITFHNNSTRGGTIFEVRLLVQPIFNSITYDMSWEEFAGMHPDERRFVSKSVVQPIVVRKQESVSELVQFIWTPYARPFEIEEGDYDIQVLVWTRRTQKPQIVFSSRTKITKEHTDTYKKCLEQELPLTMELLLGNTHSTCDLTTQSETKKRYGSI